MKNKIGWCSMTFNPVWGCLNNCEYCYARAIAKRFYNKMYNLEWNYYGKNCPSWAFKGDYLERLIHFKPTFLVSQFEKKFPKKPQRIFVGSMSDIYYWKDEWLEKVLEKVKLYPQHTFQFLTRYPEVYDRYIFPKDCWLGVTVTNNEGYCNPTFIVNIDKIKNIKYISIEPILEEINISYINYLEVDWVIIGAETGNRKGKIIPKKEWIEDIVNYCQVGNIPIYLKDSLKDIYPVEIKEFPKEGK